MDSARNALPVVQTSTPTPRTRSNVLVAKTHPKWSMTITAPSPSSASSVISEKRPPLAENQSTVPKIRTTPSSSWACNRPALSINPSRKLTSSAPRDSSVMKGRCWGKLRNTLASLRGGQNRPSATSLRSPSWLQPHLLGTRLFHIAIRPPPWSTYW